MTTQETITPEYIIEQSKVLSEEQLLELITQYGFQQIEIGYTSVSGDSY
jgi:hypothetical protein